MRATTYARIAMHLLGAWIGICEVTAQADSCEQATPFAYFNCETFAPPFPQSVRRCYSFTTGGDSVDFTFGYFAFCSDLAVTYTLYNGLCDSITSNSTGSFSIAPEVYYVVCGTVACQTPGGIREICATEMLTLPIELIGMTAYPIDQGVVLEWTTATEIDSRAFAILRSPNLVQWSALVQVAAAGQSYTTRVYRWTDTEPVEGLVYYQLKGEDIDGTVRMLMYLPVTWHGRHGSSLGPFDLLGRRVR